jgi:hypothetical protein
MNTTIPFSSYGLPNMINSKKETAFLVNGISSYPVSCNTRKFFPDAYGTSFNWNFGDPASGVNNTFSGTLVSHTFSNSGTYIVTLRSSTNVFIAQTTIVIGIPSKTILGSANACVSGVSNNSNITNNSVVLANGESAIWSITGGAGAISGVNNQSNVTINWITLPGIITLTVANSSGCTATVTKTISAIPVINPTFNSIPSICSGLPINPLQTTSNNGITGTWSPVLNNTTTTTYTFTPSSGLCASTATLTVTILPPTNPTCIATSCLPNLTLNTPETNTTILYKRINWVETNTNYATLVGQNITMKSGDYISFKPGTHIKAGSLLFGKIEACVVSAARASIQDKEIDDFVKESVVSIYPNPTKDFVTIASVGSEIKSIVVSSLEGKTIFINNAVNNNEINIDMNFYQNGVYIVSVNTKDGVIVKQKLIKN